MAAQSENVSLGDFAAETKSEQPEKTTMEDLAKGTNLTYEKSENTSTEPETSEKKNEDNSDASQLAETAKRPKGPFLRFALANRDKYQASHPKFMHHQLFRLMGKDWKKLSEDEKKPYNDQFHEELLEYKKLNPDSHYATSQEGSTHLQSASIRRQRLRPEPPKLLPFEPVETPRKKRRNRCEEPRPASSNKARVMRDDSESYEKYAESWQHANQGNAFKTTAFMDIFRKADAATRKSIIKEMAWGIFEHF